MSDESPKQIERYLAHLEHVRNLSPHTCRAVRVDLEAFNAFVHPLQISQVDRLKARAFVADLASRNAARTIARKLSHLRGFYRWLEREGIIEHSPLDGIPNPRQGRPLPGVMSVDAVVNMIGGAQGVSARDARDLAILELLYASGIRVGELVSLDVAAVGSFGLGARVEAVTKLRTPPCG